MGEFGGIDAAPEVVEEVRHLNRQAGVEVIVVDMYYKI